MKKRSSVRKLQIHRETLRALQVEDVRGGATTICCEEDPLTEYRDDMTQASGCCP